VRKVAVANRESITTTHRGTLVVSDKKGVEIRLKNVIAILEIRCNLLSLGSLVSDRINVGFEGNVVRICTTNSILIGKVQGDEGA
jgi:hypothetical protein